MQKKTIFVSAGVTLCNNDLFHHFVFYFVLYLSKFASLYNLPLYTDIFILARGRGGVSPTYLVFCYFIFR